MITLAALLAIALLLGIPGAIVGPRLGIGRLSSPVGLAGAFAAGLALDANAVAVVDRWGGGWPMLLETLALSITAVVLLRPRPPPANAYQGRFTPALALLVLATGAWAAVGGGILKPMSDAWIHLGRVRRVDGRTSLVPLSQDGEKQLNEGSWYALLAGTCRAVGADPLQVWSALPALLAPLAVLSAYAVGLALSRRNGEAVAMACGFVFLFEGQHLDWLRELPYPRYVAWIPLLVALGAAVRMARTGRLDLWVAILLLITGAGCTHILEAAFFPLIVGSALAAMIVLDPRGCTRAASRLFALWFLGCLATALSLWLMHTEGSEVVWGRVGRMLDVGGVPNALYLTDRMFIVDPLGPFGPTIGAAGAVATLLTVLIPDLVRSNVTAAFLLGPTWVPFLLCLNPILLPGFLRFYGVPEVVDRLALVSFAPLWAALLMVRIGVRPVLWRRWQRIGILMLLVAAVLPSIRLHAAARSVRHEEERQIDALGGAIEVVGQAGQIERAPCRVLTDPFTGFLVYALTQHEPMDWGMSRSTGLEQDIERSASLVAFRRRWQTSREFLEMLRARRVRLVIDHHTPALWSDDVRSNLLPWYDLSTHALLGGNPNVFRRVYHGVNADLYRVLDVGRVDHVSGKDVPFSDCFWALTNAVVDRADQPVPVGDGLSVIGTAWAGRSVVHAGETAVLGIALQAQRTMRLLHRVQLSAVNFGYRGQLYRPAWGKPYRWIRQLLEGRIYKLGVDSDLVSPPLLGLPMERGRTISGLVTFPVPASAEPGEYAVYARVERLDVVPRFDVSITDRWTDNVARIGTLTVETPR